MTRQGADYPLDYTQGPGRPDRDRLQELTDTATDRLQAASEQAHEIANKVSEQAQELGERAAAMAKEYRRFAERSVKERPMATLAVASLIGFALGALWKK